MKCRILLWSCIDYLRQDFIKFDPEKIMEVSTGLEQQHKKFPRLPQR